MADRTNKARVLSLKGWEHRLKVENFFLMPLLGELDRALILEGKLQGSNLPFPSPCWGPPVILKLADGCLSSLES